ncbi:MAG: GAF domain-containing protein [Anaerolineales bacterium]|nr:GAF domain-containing protein [Anaerolineales bacterium]
MSSVQEETSRADTDPRLLEALASLNRIGAAINRISPRDSVNVEATLQLTAESATKVVPGASAVIYAYDPNERAFDLASRVSAGESDQTAARPGQAPLDAPRPQGIGWRAIGQRRRVLSYEEADLDIHPAKVRAGARAMACYPLVVAHQPVGVLYVYLHQDRQFSQLELLMLDNFVNQAAMALYQARRLASIQRDLARKEDELTRLRRAGILISSRLRLEETLESILQMAMEVTGAEYGIFRLVDERGLLVTRAIAGERMDRPQVGALPIDESSVMGWVGKYRQPVCIHDLQAAPWVLVYRPLDARLKMRSELAVPLVGSGGRLEGVLNLESPVVGAFSEEDSHLLQALATQAVIAIQEVRLLDALQEVAQLLLSQPRQQVLDRLATLACDLLDASASAIWLLDGPRLLRQSESGNAQQAAWLPVNGSLIGQAVQRREQVETHEGDQDPRVPPAERSEALAWTRALAAPLLTSDDHQPIGAFSVCSCGTDRERPAASEWDGKVLACLAHYATLAVQNTARQEALRTSQEQHAVAETFAVVGDIAANVLHHLNNKVGSIPVRVQGIEDKCQKALLADGYLASNLEEIERSASEALAAVRESLSHLNPIHPVPIQVAPCVAEAISTSRLPADVTIHLGGLEQLPPVVAGQRVLALVFANLLSNAAEAMQGVGTVEIGGTADGAWVEIYVTDTGPGIPPELHERIFELNDASRSSTRPGRLGFGLWWVKTLMARLGGSVGVESDGAHGTTFRLRLPQAQEPS